MHGEAPPTDDTKVAAGVEASPRAAFKKALTQDELAVLSIELHEMMRLDQLYRTPVSWGTLDRAELERLEALDDDATLAEWGRRNREGISLPKALEKELMAKQEKLDAANLKQLAEIMETIGYPDPTLLGIDAPDPLPVLIHAQLEGYDAVASELLEEARAGRLRAKAYAALSDRKRQHRGMTQLYGTCKAMDRATGKILPPGIESIEATNAARAELGMPELKEYRIVPGAGERR